MIELVFAACLAASPDTCKERSIWFIDTTPEQCEVSADRQLEKWVEVNPLWNVGEWKCWQIGNRDARLVIE